MAQTIELNGEDYILPTSNDVDWGASMSRWMRDITAFVNTFQNAVSVVDFGATGDGVTDDTEAIQDAVDAAESGSSIIFPKPSLYYKISAPIDLTGKTGIELKFSKSSVSGFNILNTYAGPAFKLSGTTYSRIVDASIKNTDTSAGVGIYLTALSYEIDLDTIHVRDGFAGIQIGEMAGTVSFNTFIRRCKFESTSDTLPVTLTYGILCYSAVNIMVENCYTHGCVTGYKRLVPTAGATVKYFDNIHFFHCIAEYCTTHGFDLIGAYGVTLERPYIEEWGRGDASPTSFAINLTGLSFTDIAVDHRSVAWRVNDAQIFGQGSQSGTGKILGCHKYFHYLEYKNVQSSPGRHTHLLVDDEDATDRGERAGRPIVVLEGREYGLVTYTDSQAIVYERGITGGNQNLDTVAAGTKSDVGSGVARGSVGETVTSSRKFAHRSYAIRGSAHMAEVVDTDGIYDTKFSTGSPNNSYDDNRFFGRRMNATTDGFFARSLQNDVKFDVSMGSGFAKVQCTKEDATSSKLLKLNTDGGGVQVGGTYDNPLRMGTFYLWVSAAGNLYIKSSAPSNETDGTVVGTQT